MKNLTCLSILILLSFFLACSTNEYKEQLTKVILVGANLELSVPESFELIQLQGHDSYVADIVNSNDDTFKIKIDIGSNAGSYVDVDSKDAELHESVNELFLFENRESGYWGSEDCCSFYTFLELGPANFICRNNKHADLVFEIMKSLKSI